MRNSKQSLVYGQTAPRTRFTKASAVMLATAVSMPVFVILTVIDWLWL